MVRETRHLWVSNQPEIVREDRIRDHFKRSTEDVSPQSFEQRGSSYYDRNSRLVSETDQYIRRPNNIHPSEIRGSNNFHPSDLRGRTRERVYRNGPCSYPSIAERSISGGHHRVSSWYDTGSSSISSISGQGSSPATRSVYGNVASAVVQPDTSALYDCQVLKSKNKKSRSGSESPCGGSSSVIATSSHSSSHIVDRGNGGSAASSRSHSRSPSSCSSTNSTSSNSHASSPVSGSDPPLSSTSSTTSRSRNLQSAVSAPNQSGKSDETTSMRNTLSSTCLLAGNLVVHSEDNRPLAICVRNLPARSSDTSLKDGLFHEYKKHGKVTWVKVVGQNAERYALVCFKKPEDVEKALEVSQDKLFFGCKIEVEPYQGYDVEDNEFRPYEAELDEYHPKSTRTLFIGNLEKDITGSDIRNHFECFGEIIEIDIKKQGMNAYAFCQYSDIVSVVKAMRKMDGEHLGNNRIKLGFGKSMPTNCVWIDGIADSVSENYLMQQFKSYGPITEVVIDRDRKLALVSFEQVQYAQLAVKEMRGATLRGRKLQVDFASRECREKFCSKVEKQTASSRFSSRYGCSGNSGTGGGGGTADTPSTSQSRSRASSFSRHNSSATATAVGGSSPAGSGSGASVAGGSGVASSSTGVIGVGSSSVGLSGTGGTTPRGSRSSRIIRHADYDYSEGRLRSYDEYSQGSAASHDDDSYNYSSSCLRSDSPQSRLAATTLDTLEVSSTSSGRRRCDKSPGDIRNLQKERFQILEQLEECPSSGDELVSPKKRMKFDHSSHHHNHHHTISSLTQSVQPTTQLSSSVTSSSAPSGSLALGSTIGPHDCNTSNTSSNNTSSSLQPTNPLIGDSNCDVYSNHSNVTSCTLHHRKCVEVRRLSECSLNHKYGSQLSSSSATATSAVTASSSRRPSTEISGGIGGSGSTAQSMFPATGGSGSTIRHSGSSSSIGTQDSSSMSYAAPHSVPCKRRRTGTSCIVGNTSVTIANNATSDSTEHHSSRGRGHQLHSHHSHEASGGESADGSRPGTPLCDERPEVSLSEPRRMPRDKPHEPMMLPLPKFGIQFFQQHRLAASGGGGGGLGGQSTICGGAASSLLLTGQSYSSSSNNSSSSANISNMNSCSGLLNNTSSSSSLLNSNNNNNNSSHSSLSNTLSSPPPTLVGSSRLSATPLHHHHHHSSNNSSGSNSSTSSLSHNHHHQTQQPHHHHQQHHTNYHHGAGSSHGSGEQPPSSPLRPRSLSSNSSDSDGAPISTSPSIEERLKTLDEMYEIWSGGGSAGNSVRPHSLSSDHASNVLHSRHKFLELDVNEVKPSEFVKRVLAKKSIFDDDLQRLKNISDKYETADFSNVSRSSLVSTSPGIPNLAATKTPVVGGNPVAKQAAAQSTSVFHSPSVNSLQRLNSPMNSPQAMSPYNSPSPSPVVSATMAKTANSQQTVVPPQPAKGLQYPFPSHPPVVMAPTTPPTTPVLSAAQPKPKIATTTKSFSLQEKPVTQPPVQSAASAVSGTGVVTGTGNPNRVLCKSASVPGSTNVGTVKAPLAVLSPNPLTTANNPKVDEPSEGLGSTNSSRRGSADLPAKSTYQKSSATKKTDKAHKQNHRSDSDAKKSKSEKSRSESIDKRKASISSEDKEEVTDMHEKDNAAVNERLSGDDDRPKKSESGAKETTERTTIAPAGTGKRTEKEKAERKLEKRREKEEKEREDRERKAAAAEQEQRETEERERRERERKEREEKEQKERERREREERERVEELSRKERAEREERERKEREERERKEREDRERKDRDERDRREREERERKEREERERREKEEAARREREENARREREEREKKEREEAAKREKEERERKEREDALRREREDRERREREESFRREREERERREREREERERREKEERERREKEDRERREKEECERREKEAEERQKREREEQMQREREDRERKVRDRLDSKDHDDHMPEKRERRERDQGDRKEREERRSEARTNEQPKESNPKDRFDYDELSKSEDNDEQRDHRSKDDEFQSHLRQLHHHKEEKHHHKDNNNDSHLSMGEEQQTNASQTKRRTSASSPIRMAKRRLSSQDSMDPEETTKRAKLNSESRKGLDRLDSKDSNRSSSKHHKSHSRASSLTKNPEDKLLVGAEERCRKDSGFEEKKIKDKEHKKYEKASHKHKKSSTSTEKEDHEVRSPTEKSMIFEMHDLRSSDDDHQLQQQQRHRNKKEHKEKKRHDHDEEPHRRSSDSKRHDNNRHDRKLSTKSEDSIPKSISEKSRSKPPSRKMTQSSNDSDSDEPKKHSIFDIPDDGPYVSMYDKVKARSCKNMQKQEEEKKIKAKFSQLKQSRAKREEKKRSTSYDGDSDSDFDDRQTKYKRSSFINSSSDEENSAINRIKDTPISDSDSDVRRAQYNRARLNELCDGDSSEGGSIVGKTVPCKKISSKRNSRSTRIVSDSSDTESPNRVKAESYDKGLHSQQESVVIKQEVKTEDENEVKNKVNRFGAIKTEKEEPSEESSFDMKLEIKEEPNDDIYSSHVSESEANMCSGSAVESKDSVLDQLFTADIRKKHKKSKKRQKLGSSHASEVESDKVVDMKAETHLPTSLEHVFDELKRESMTTTNTATIASASHFPEKKKHKDRKEKKREKSRDEYEKLSKEERHRLRKSKKSKCSGERYVPDGSLVASKRSGEKMEDIFGPISDDETQLSMTDSLPKDSSSLLYENISSSHNLQPVVSAALNPYKQEPLTPKSHTVEENEENKQKSSSHAERERHRKEKREKKRKERERNREQHALAAFQQQKHEDENSVDLDEAGRALEAQLMEDSDNKLTEETTPSTATTHKSDMHDVFRFSDGDENSMEVTSQEKKDHPEPHKSKEKKKKKKRSKEERHQKREHHHHASTHNNSLPSLTQMSTKLSIEISTPAESTEDKSDELCKPSPSLPCLLDESPPRKNNSRSDLDLAISPLSREQPSLISPIPKTPTLTSSVAKPIECKKKPDKFIPGFDVELDEKISESAVKSISTEFTSPKVEPPIVDESKMSIESVLDPKSDKIEEKSRVVISQEETEDAVAALLGESFGTNTVDYSFSDDPCEIQPEEDVDQHDTAEACPVIPEEEAEEMRKAVQSLGTEDIEIKPDTPQSEQDLQIDTDTEDQDEEVLKVEDQPSKSSTDTNERPKQPAQPTDNVKPSQSEKQPTPADTKSISSATKSAELKADKEVEIATASATKALIQSESEKVNEIVEKIDRASPQINFPTTPQRSNSSPSLHQTAPQSPSIPASPKSGPTSTRSQPQFVMQPPTISIPESGTFMYPPINIMLSPRGAAGNDNRMPSPRHTQQGAQPKVQQPSSSQFVNVRVSSPQSPNMRGSQSQGIRHPNQLSPVVPAHMVIQQRQLMSPPHAPSPTQVQAASSGNITMNRIPVTTVLAPISKPIQQANILLPQPNNAILTRADASGENKDGKLIGPLSNAYQTARVSTPTSSSCMSPVNIPGQAQSPGVQITSQPTIKSVVESHGPTQIQQVVPIQLGQNKGAAHQTVVLQSPPPQTSKQPHLQTIQSGRSPSQQQSQSQQMQQQMVKIAQQQQMFQQHQMMQQQRQQQMQMQQQQHAAQILQIQQKQVQQQQKQQVSQQQNQQVIQSHRVVHQQTLQLHPGAKLPPSSLSQPLAKDVTHKIAVQMTTQLVQSIASKDLQQARIQQNVVVVRHQGNVVPQQAQVLSKAGPTHASLQTQTPGQPQVMQQQTSQPIILQQRQTPLSQVASIFQQKVPSQLHQTAGQNVNTQSPMKTQIAITLPQEPVAQVAASQAANIPVVATSTKLPVNEETNQQKNANRSEASPKLVSGTKDKDQSEVLETSSGQKERESEVPAIVVKPNETKREVGKVDVKSVCSQPPQQLQQQQHQQELENVSVIKSQTAATPVQPVQSSILSEENVSKFSVPIDDQAEHDSKEEWSAKELNLNLESVIKKVDALCSNDEEMQGNKKPENNPIDVKENVPSETQKPTTEVKDIVPEQITQVPVVVASTADQEKKSEHTEMPNVNNTESEKNEDTHDEEEFDEVVDAGKPMRGGKRGGRSTRGGKRATGGPLSVAITVQGTATNAEGVQTRRGKSSQGSRGRKGRGGQSRSPAAAAPTINLAEKKNRNQSSDQDVYEFHEDSGEENLSTKNERPRLILTIKPGQAAPQVIQAKSSTGPATSPQPTQPAQVVAPMSVAIMGTSQPPTTQSAPEATTPPQKEQKDREEFTTPATNTRKSRRLLEKDGGVPIVRNTVDDTIEDVVRNISSPKVPPGSQTPPRRSTRNSAQISTSRPAVLQPTALDKSINITDVRKSPRANRRSKDRKTSETSVDSSDEKSTQFEEKVVAKQHSPQTLSPQEQQQQSQVQQQMQNVVADVKGGFERKSDAESVKDEKEPLHNASQKIPSPHNKPNEPLAMKPQDPNEPQALLDPVTGLLTFVLPKEEIKRDEKPDHKLQDIKRPETQHIITVDSHKVTNVVVKTSQSQPAGTPPNSCSPGISQPNVPRTQTSITPVLVQQQAQKLQVHVQPQILASQPQETISVQVTQAHQPAQSQLSQHQTQEAGKVYPAQVQVQQQPHLPPHSTAQTQPQTQPQSGIQGQQPSQTQSQLQPQIQQQMSSHMQPHLQSQAQSQIQSPIQSQQQHHPIRTHPLKAHMLNSQHNTVLNKPIVSQSVVKVATGIVSQPTTVVTSSNISKPQQTTIVQSNIVTRHVPQGVLPQQPQQAINLGQSSHQTSGQPIHNLYVNIPPSSAAVQVAVAHSPRMQQPVVAKPDQGATSQQPVQLLHVVTKPLSGGQSQQLIAQHQPVVIHSNKIPQGQTQYATVVQSGKIIQQATPIQTTVGGKPQTIQVTMPHMSQQQQQGTSSQQAQQQQQQHQVHAQQLQHIQKQSSTISVVTHQLGKQVQIPVQSQQQTHPQQHPSTPPSHIVQTVQQASSQHHMAPQTGAVNNAGKSSGVTPNTIHLVAGQPSSIILGSQHIVSHAAHQSPLVHQPSGGATILQAKPAHQQQIPVPNKSVIGLHQSTQIMTGAVPSPPLKQSHMGSQQPVVTGASSLRASVPPISPQGQARSHMLQSGMATPAFEANMGEGTFASGAIRGMPRDHYIMYQQYYRAQPEARIPYIPRSPLVQGSGADQKDMSEVDDAMVASPPLELRRPGSGPRTIPVPHSLQSPQDRATDSPQVAQVYVHTRIPHPQYQEVGGRYFEPVRQVTAEPPPAHRPAHSVVAPSPSRYATEQPQTQPAGQPANLAHIHPKMLGREREREREQREREQREREQREREQRDNEACYYVDDKRDRLPRKRESERTSIPQGHTGMPSHDSLVPAMPTPTGRSIQVATPPHASQVPPQGDSLLTLLQRYPVMWQGLLALKTDQAAVQMHFVFGNPMVARGSLPCNSDGTTPPLRIAQRMRLEQTQLDGVAKKMQYDNEHCMLLALPCGRNHMDVLQQSRNLQTGFITYLQQKMAAGIVNIPVPGSDQAAYVVHIFPSCDFANENLERAAPDLKHRVAEIAHLLIIIATV